MAFHVATLMPTKLSDPKCTSKKQHIGNNYVTVVYNESGEPYNIQTVKVCFIIVSHCKVLYVLIFVLLS